VKEPGTTDPDMQRWALWKVVEVTRGISVSFVSIRQLWDRMDTSVRNFPMDD
jgi:hypothetical protein